ncbi:hypothetical protein OOZ15_17600 [Galbibacter sp. EGI 63066]|uniref:RHS repeat-associated core domain-containing protein n=1 Tax=Galbibacter sp. EGI 63066 TaxID=2993559 RepID=UPI002249579D|nr:RHS repeat-associated core domain-containing protein [Galbibacter sp. EGI 63066]MCX2681773.1 hypothetical protein [Galbibacter sp. EGI 63066]
MTEGGSVTKTTDYAGNYIYEDVHTGEGPILQFFSHAEGYVDAEGGGYDYVYQYKDHLGNIRLSYMDANNNGGITADEIIEESNYYPFGLKHRGYNYGTSPLGNSAAQRWKYNGVELEESLGLDLYEMDYRSYSSDIGRFNSIDPAAEMARNWTTYRFGFNNPVLFNDPIGLWEIKSDGSWYTDNEKDISRFLNMLRFESMNEGNISGAQIDTFIGEEFRGSGGRLSNGDILLDEDVIVADDSGKYGDLSPRQVFNLGEQVEKYGSNPWNEKSSGGYGHWAYSYKYHRERNYYTNGGEGLSSIALSGAVLDITSAFLKNESFWLGKNFKFYDVNWGGNGVTGGKNKFAGKWSSRLGKLGSVASLYGAYNTYEEYQSGKLSTAGAVYLGATDAAGLRNIYGSMWSLGTGIGKTIVESSWYFNTFYKDYNW